MRFTGPDRISQWPGSRVISAQKANTAAACADHNIAWRTRHALALDRLSSGNARGLSPAPRQDNIIYDLNPADKHHAADNSASGFGHPLCGFNEQNAALPAPQSLPSLASPATGGAGRCRLQDAMPSCVSRKA